MPKKSRFGTPFYRQHAKESQRLLKSARQHFSHVFLSLWKKWSWKMSLSVISEILGLSLTHWLQMTTILFMKVEIYHNQFKCNYVRKKNFSPHFLIQFWNLNQILNILKKKDDPQSLCVPKMWLDKSLKTSVSEHRFTINMVKGTKECRNLYWGTFIQISHYYESNGAGKCLFYWYLKFYDRLLIDSLLMTRILFTIGKIYKNQLKYNYNFSWQHKT